MSTKKAPFKAETLIKSIFLYLHDIIPIEGQPLDRIINSKRNYQAAEFG